MSTDVGWILVREWSGNGDSIAKDDYGSVILFRTEADAAAAKSIGETPKSLVRWCKPKKAPR